MKFLKKQSSIFWVSLLGILGFSIACTEGEKYGTPSTTYKIKGKVVSSADQHEISGIQAVLQYQYLLGDTLLTNEKGEFSFTKESPENIFKIKLSDIDGAENGEFQDKEIQVTFDGIVEKDLGKIQLQTK